MNIEQKKRPSTRILSTLEKEKSARLYISIK